MISSQRWHGKTPQNSPKTKKYNNNHYHHHHHHKIVNWTRKWLQLQINKLEAHLFPPNILNSDHNKIGWSHELQQPPQTSSRIESQGKANKFITMIVIKKTKLLEQNWYSKVQWKKIFLTWTKTRIFRIPPSPRKNWYRINQLLDDVSEFTVL